MKSLSLPVVSPPFEIVFGRNDRIGRDLVDDDLGPLLDLLEQISKRRIVERRAGRILQFFLHLGILLVRRRRSEPRLGRFFHRVGIDRIQEAAGEITQRFAACRRRDLFPILVLDFPIQRGEPPREARKRIVASLALGDLVEQLFEAHARLALERLGCRLVRFGDPDAPSFASISTKRVFAEASRVTDFRSAPGMVRQPRPFICSK